MEGDWNEREGGEKERRRKKGEAEKKRRGGETRTEEVKRRIVEGWGEDAPSPHTPSTACTLSRVRVRWLCLRCRAVVRCACVCVLRLSSPSPSRWLLFSACPRHLARWASSTALPTCCRPPEPAGIPYIPQWMHLPSSASPRRARGHARGTSRRPCGRLKLSAVSWRAAAVAPQGGGKDRPAF